ncbi:IclR family transcriptional regulator [Clostridium formicaceticum]|uniref:Glycerol operon regulatory protein n=1 Tax=Clostridium formicaceticum TaxID=1497 RepID=A0AAC9RI18_9CLOT|nr:IclR family transcriptional regulator [Clostridium formicaceticum]AOY76064.1 IclR family transcriptional regulator [Clostridium formicaceticum]ARE86426.1 Transcriptional regulator KdgR [Clostridium formicaceticum]
MKETVQSVDRALSILEVLSDYEEGVGITEISSKIDLHKSTVHRLLVTLICKGYVEQNPSTNKYKLTLKLLELGNKLIDKMDILSVAKPYLQQLTEITNEVVHLVVREGIEIVYIDKVESDNKIRMHSRIGSRSPMYCTSVGKAMMAYLPEEEVEKIWEASEIKKFTQYTITELQEMKETLKKVREVGYALDEEENELGIRCIGSPIFNHNGEVCGAISVSGPTMRVTKETIENFKNYILEYSSKISKELGYKVSM